MSQPNALFLSYRSVERPFAARLAADLKNAGFSVWIDCMDIRPGSAWDSATSDAIDGCSGLIAILSPSYLRSEICLNELARAQRAGRPVIPVLLEPLADETDWPLLIQRRQYVDFSEWADSARYRARLDDLLGEIHRAVADSAGALPDAETRYLNLLLAEMEAARGSINT
jgi:TIR domain